MFKFVRATISAVVALFSFSHCICFIITVVNHCFFEQINDDDDDDDDDDDLIQKVGQ